MVIANAMGVSRNWLYHISWLVNSGYPDIFDFSKPLSLIGDCPSSKFYSFWGYSFHLIPSGLGLNINSPSVSFSRYDKVRHYLVLACLSNVQFFRVINCPRGLVFRTLAGSVLLDTTFKAMCGLYTCTVHGDP